MFVTELCRRSSRIYDVGEREFCFSAVISKQGLHILNDRRRTIHFEKWNFSSDLNLNLLVSRLHFSYGAIFRFSCSGGSFQKLILKAWPLPASVHREKTTFVPHISTAPGLSSFSSVTASFAAAIRSYHISHYLILDIFPNEADASAETSRFEHLQSVKRPTSFYIPPRPSSTVTLFMERWINVASFPIPLYSKSTDLPWQPSTS